MNPTPETTFNLDCLRLEVARSLPAQYFDDFQRLTRTLIHGPAFQWLLVDARHELLREQVIQALDKVLAAAGLRVSRLQLGWDIADVGSLEAQLVQSAAQAQVVHVIGVPGWFDAARWDAFNLRRERIAANARARLVFWLDADAIGLASQGAPDLWAWRSGVYAFAPLREFAEGGGATLAAFAQTLDAAAGLDNRNKTERYRRIGEIQSWINAHPDAPDEMLVAPLHELGRLLFNLGDYEAALAHWREVVLPFHQHRGAEREVAITQGRIADLLQSCGQLDEALRIRREKELPVFERLGDMLEYAKTQGKIAGILGMFGHEDEALNILREDVLPVFEGLGNLRSSAITQGHIADILQERGQLDEALRIRREEALPVFERLGDVRECALTQGRIADILQSRGQFDEALRIWREEVLPVFERVGDIHARASTQGKIANILQMCGQLDEALRIRREDELPVYERLGDLRGRAVCQFNSAKALQAKGPEHALEAQALLREALQTFTQLVLPEADVVMHELRQLEMETPPASST